MEQIPRFVKGYVKIRLESPMPERFLSLCVHNQIPVWNLKNRDLYYEMELSVKDFFRLNPFRRKTQSRIILLEKHGMPFFFQKNQKRKAFFLGSFLFLSLLYLCSLFIWDIRVEGNHYNSKETILETLQTFQVKDGILKKNLDCRQIASQIRASFPNVVWVSARINGTCLVLEIKENEDSYQESSTKEQEGAQMKNWNLAASQNGVIVRMITRSGMPLAKEGDACKIGDILVSGKLEILDNDAQVQRYEYVQADADIDLLTTYAYYDEFPLKHTVKEYIGPKKKYRMIRLFGREFSMYRAGAEHTEVYQMESPVYLTSSFCLPVSYGNITVVPYQKKEAVYEKEEALEISAKHLQVFLEHLVQQGAVIQDKKIDVQMNHGTCIARGRVTVIERTGKKVPIEQEMPNVREN